METGMPWAGREGGGGDGEGKGRVGGGAEVERVIYRAEKERDAFNILTLLASVVAAIKTSMQHGIQYHSSHHH